MFKKKFKKVQIERRFIKEASVFSAWKLDDFGITKKCLEHDERYWKVATKVLKDKEDYKSLMRIIKKDFNLLKAMHIHMASSSIFPATSEPEWRKF